MRRNRILAVALAASTLAACSESKDPAVSPGTVTLRLLLPQGQEFCDIIYNCSAPTHILIGKESGNWLTVGVSPCDSVARCSTCTPPVCSDGACPTIGIAVGVPVTSVETTWNGSSVDWSTCGSGARCYSPTFVPAGRYVARLCATPGMKDADTQTTCMQTGPEECVETTFDLPGPPLVEVPLG